ncbi:MAG: xanthine dehydrogenase family protein molybdopterin-binding subunit [Spirochaetales bacterium]|nr:xanthine dehydrogenase family protein molybdopterin-binding subunit [Spirochaetales bacterium]
MTGKELRIVGRRVRKVDGIELVTGQAKFTADMKLPGMLYGFARRAGQPAGKLEGVKKDEALKIPGVVDVLTAEDLPGPNLIGVLPPFDQPVLATGDIRYAGESVAFVVAETREAAKRGAAALDVRITEVPPILTVDEALGDGARKIHENGNITFSRKLIKGDADKALAEAPVVVENTYETSFQDHAYLEPETDLAVPGGDGRITVYASCQSPFHLRGLIAANLSVPAGRVKVVQSNTGGSFGGKDDVAVEIGILAAAAALRTGRPVLVAHERGESMVGSNLRHASRITITTGATKEGKIVARKIKIILDGGAYASESPFVVMKALIHAAGPYLIPHVFVESTAVYTNKTYAGAFRGFGVPQVTFASESQMDELAAKLGMNPLTLRKINALRPGDATATGQVFKQSVGLLQAIEILEKERLPEKPEDPSDRYLYGTGHSCMLQGISNGAEGVDVVGATVQVSQDGSALVGLGLTELGQGSRTVYAQIAAEELGIPLETVTVRQVDTDSVHDSGPTVASRSTTVGGMAVLKAAREVKESLLDMAALMLQTDKKEIYFQDGFAILSKNPDARIPLREVATAAYWTGHPLMHLAFSKAPEAKYDHDTHQGSIYIAYNFGAHRMSIRIDRWTGEVRVLEHLAAHDVGKVINPVGLEGQVEGGSLIGYGYAHMEKIEESRGIIRNANFADYAVPSIKDRIPTRTLVVEEANPTGPYGAKGVGEPPVAATAACFANAVSDALGVRFTRLPVTRQDILRALQSGAATHGGDKNG